MRIKRKGNKNNAPRQQQKVYDIIITRAGRDRRLASHVIRFYLHLRLTLPPPSPGTYP